MPKNEYSSIGKANILLFLQFLSDFGDQITTALLALCVVDITKSTDKVGFIYFITTSGFIVFTLAGGYLGDKLHKRNILFYSDFGRGIVVLFMIFALREKSVTLIYIASFFLSVLSSLHRPVKLSIWAQSIPTRCLERYNCFSEFSAQTSMIMGPLMASLFIAKQQINIGFTIDAITFFICAITFAVIISEKTIKCQSARKTQRNIFHGFRLIARNSELARYVSYDAIQMIGFGAFNATFLVLAQRDFNWSKAEYSYHLSIIAACALFGAWLGTTKLMASINTIKKLIACAILSAMALIMVLYFQTFPLSSILFGICDGIAVITIVVTKTKAQLLAMSIHPNFLSSILASRSIIIKAATLLGTATCLIIDDFLSLKLTLAFYVLPIGLSFLPLVLRQEKSVRLNAT